MKFGKVVGTVVSTQKVEALEGIKLLLIQPLDEQGQEIGDVLVAMDPVQAGEGDHVFYESSKEAAQAFKEWFSPADVAIFGIIDHVDVGHGKDAE
ncbi:MAG: EutN/CcmL family microcompartment protein [Planctomycetes bacterium]|nr:EutN/CcmL family microcompartment protein [Planctomycetota bacterium]